MFSDVPFVNRFTEHDSLVCKLFTVDENSSTYYKKRHKNCHGKVRSTRLLSRHR